MNYDRLKLISSNDVVICEIPWPAIFYNHNHRTNCVMRSDEWIYSMRQSINRWSFHVSLSDMDECYPAISMTTAVNGHKNVHNVHNNNNNNNYINYLQTLQQNNVSLHNNNNNNNHHHNNNNSNSNLNNSNINNNNNNNSSLINSNNVSVLHSFKFSHKKKGSDVSSTTSGSDFELDSTDEATIKEEPMSPGSSCPPSPTQCGAGYTVNLANMAAYTNSDLVFDHKVSC